MMHLGPHLNDDQFAECALFAPTPECAEHLAECARCREELETFTASVGAFNQASMAWSEAQPSVSLRGLVKSRAGRAIFVPGAGWALATVVVLAVAVPVMSHQHHAAELRNAATLSTQDDSAAQIADDDRLMQSVDVALAANEPSPLAEYGLSREARVHGKAMNGSDIQ